MDRNGNGSSESLDVLVAHENILKALMKVKNLINDALLTDAWDGGKDERGGLKKGRPVRVSWEGT